MQRYASVCRLFAWIVLVIAVFFQAIAIAATFHYQNATVGNPVTFGVLLLVASVLLILGAAACMILPRGKSVLFWITVIGAVGCIALGCFMPVVFKFVRNDELATTVGISVIRAIFCHIAPPLAIAILLIPTWSAYREKLLNDKYHEEMERTPSYFDTLGDMEGMHLSDGEETPTSPKPKRSVRDRQRKENRP